MAHSNYTQHKSIMIFQLIGFEIFYFINHLSTESFLPVVTVWHQSCSEDELIYVSNTRLQDHFYNVLIFTFITDDTSFLVTCLV